MRHVSGVKTQMVLLHHWHSSTKRGTDTPEAKETPRSPEKPAAEQRDNNRKPRKDRSKEQPRPPRRAALSSAVWGVLECGPAI